MIFSVNLTGKNHRADHRECEDALYISPDERVVVVCDGVSNSKYGGSGAHVLADKLGKRLSEVKPSFFEDNSLESIRNETYYYIKEKIQDLANRHPGSKLDDFASTLLAYVKVNDKCACIIHCGDGCIFAKPKCSPKDFSIVLSSPDQDGHGNVFAACDEEQLQRMRVMRIRLDDYEGIALCTDGFSEPFLRRGEDVFSISESSVVFQAQSNGDLLNIVTQYHKRVGDDITCALIKPSFKSSHKPQPQPQTYQTAQPVTQYSGKGKSKKRQKQAQQPQQPQREAEPPEATKDTRYTPDIQPDIPEMMGMPIEKLTSKPKFKLKLKIDKKALAIVALTAVLVLIFSIAFAKINSLSRQNREIASQISQIASEYSELSDRLETLSTTLESTVGTAGEDGDENDDTSADTSPDKTPSRYSTSADDNSNTYSKRDTASTSRTMFGHTGTFDN